MTEQVQDQAPVVVKSPLELAIAKYKLAATKLSKVETRAAEFDAEAAKLNAEMADVCLGKQAQTKDRTVMVIAKEQDAATKKAAKVRKSGAVLAADARDALAELTDALRAEILAGRTAAAWDAPPRSPSSTAPCTRGRAWRRSPSPNPGATTSWSSWSRSGEGVRNFPSASAGPRRVPGCA